MTRMLDAIVPDALRAVLAQGEYAPEGFTVLVLTASDGWPHLAMVSVGELIARDEKTLALALWPSSRTTAALSPTGRGTLAFVLEGISYLVRIETRRGPDLQTPLAGQLAQFQAHVRGATADEAPYAVLESGVRFRLKEREETFARWREVRAALAAGGSPG